MTATTVKSMNLLMQRRASRINAKVPGEMKKLIIETAKQMNMSESKFIMIAIAEKLERIS